MSQPLPVVDLEHRWTLVPPAVDFDDDLVRAAGHARRLLPAALHEALMDFSDDPGRTGALLIRGLNLGSIPPTPSSPLETTIKDQTSEFTMLTIARSLGQPVGYLPEHGGTVVQNIVPVPGQERGQISTSSRVELLFHTEAAFHPHRPRYLLLACLRGDPDAATTLSSARMIHPLLSPEDLSILFSPVFRTAVDESYVGSRRVDLLGDEMSVLWGEPEAPRLTFDADLMVGTTPESQDVLERFAATITAHHLDVVLRAGDLLVVDNTVAVHGRSPFQARFDGTDRWLQRVMVVSDLAASAHERTGRIITTRWD